MISFGGNKQRSSGSQESFVWGQQAPYLESLFGQASRMSDSQMGTIGQDAANLSGGLMQGAGPWAMPGANPAIGNLMQRAQQGNPYLSQQIEGLGSDIGQTLQKYIMPGIASTAGLHGPFGGSRHGVAAGLAGSEAIRQFTQGATNLRSNAYGQGIQSAMGAGQLASQGVGQLGDLYNLGMSPYQAQWAPLQAFGGLLGDPTVLQRGTNMSRGGGGSFSFLGG